MPARRRDDPRLGETRRAQTIDDVEAVVAEREDAGAAQRIDVVHRLHQMLDVAIAKARAFDRVG